MSENVHAKAIETAVEKPITDLQQHVVDWLLEKTGYKPENPEDFAMGVKLSALLRSIHQASPENKERQASYTERVGAAREEAKAKRAEEREAAKAKKAAEKAAAQAEKASDASEEDAAAPAAKPAAKPRPAKAAAKTPAKAPAKAAAKPKPAPKPRPSK